MQKVVEIRKCVRCEGEFEMKRGIRPDKKYCTKACYHAAKMEATDERAKWIVDNQHRPRVELQNELGLTCEQFARVCYEARLKGYQVKVFSCKKEQRAPKKRKPYAPRPKVKQVTVNYRQVKPDAKPMKVRDFTDGYVSVRRDSKTWVVQRVG